MLQKQPLILWQSAAVFFGLFRFSFGIFSGAAIEEAIPAYNRCRVFDGAQSFKVNDLSLRILALRPHPSSYQDDYIVLRDSVATRMAAMLYRLHRKHRRKLMKFEARLFGVKSGSMMPSYTLTVFWFNLLFNRFQTSNLKIV